jgi:hypothetical protein
MPINIAIRTIFSSIMLRLPNHKLSCRRLRHRATGGVLQ